jgi:hypothetical protein
MAEVCTEAYRVENSGHSEEAIATITSSDTDGSFYRIVQQSEDTTVFKYSNGSRYNIDTSLSVSSILSQRIKLLPAHLLVWVVALVVL